MQIFENLLRVIFMLSTIVAVTDCCSSRILFLKEQTFNMIQQHKMQQYQQYIGHEPTNEKHEQQVFAANMNNETSNNNKHHTNISSDDQNVSEQQTVATSGNDRPPPQEKGGSGVGLDEAKPFGDFGKHLSELIIKEKALQNKNNAENPGYQLMDIYQSIMDNVLSFACTGQFLTDFCLNGGRCFRVPMGNQSLFSCECADGYVGERCESKSVNGVFVHAAALESKKPKILTARIVFSFPMLILLTVIYLFFGMIIVFKCQPPFRAKYTPQSSSRAAGLLLT